MRGLLVGRPIVVGAVAFACSSWETADDADAAAAARARTSADPSAPAGADVGPRNVPWRALWPPLKARGHGGRPRDREALCGPPPPTAAAPDSSRRRRSWRSTAASSSRSRAVSAAIAPAPAPPLLRHPALAARTVPLDRRSRRPQVPPRRMPPQVLGRRPIARRLRRGTTSPKTTNANDRSADAVSLDEI